MDTYSKELFRVYPIPTIKSLAIRELAKAYIAPGTNAFQEFAVALDTNKHILDVPQTPEDDLGKLACFRNQIALQILNSNFHTKWSKILKSLEGQFRWASKENRVLYAFNEARHCACDRCLLCRFKHDFDFTFSRCYTRRGLSTHEFCDNFVSITHIGRHSFVSSSEVAHGWFQRTLFRLIEIYLMLEEIPTHEQYRHTLTEVFVTLCHDTTKVDLNSTAIKSATHAGQKGRETITDLMYTFKQTWADLVRNYLRGRGLRNTVPTPEVEAITKEYWDKFLEVQGIRGKYTSAYLTMWR